MRDFFITASCNESIIKDRVYPVTTLLWLFSRFTGFNKFRKNDSGKTQMLTEIVRPIILEIFHFYCFLALPISFRCLSLNYIYICVHPYIFLLKVAGCGDPGDVRNGNQQVFGTRWAVGTSVLYSCNQGYQISGQSTSQLTIFCQSNGLWTGSAPTCVSSTQQTGEMLTIYTYIYV